MWRLLRSHSDFQETTLRNQLTSLILHEVITTTTPNSKRLVSFADRFLHSVRKMDLNSSKLAHKTLLDKNAVKKLFEDVLPRYDETSTNYVRSIKNTPRRGDNAPRSTVMLIKEPVIDKIKAPVVKSAAKTVKKETK